MSTDITTHYYTIVTAASLALETQAKIASTPIIISKITIGDGNGTEYDPEESQTALLNEKWRGGLNSLRRDTDNANWWIAEALLPDDIGGFSIREVAYLTDTDVVYAIGKYPSSYKPVLTQGSNRQIYIRRIFQVSNDIQVTLLTDPSIVVVTKAELTQHVSADDPHSLYWNDTRGDAKIQTAVNALIASLPAQMTEMVASQVGAAITAHVGQADPHSQYATKSGVQSQAYTAFTTGGAAPSFTLTPSPTIATYAAGQRFRVKFGSAGNGADTLNVNALGAKNLRQYDATGAKVTAVIAANQLVDVEYDGAEFVLLDPLPVNPILAGEVAFFARNTAPNGYLKVNGAPISRTSYSALFAAIGTTFGAGDGSTTFNHPDLRGEFLRGWDDSRGVDSGRVFGSAQAAAVETHQHSTDGSNGSTQHAVYAGWDGNFDYGRSVSVSAADAEYKSGSKTGTYGGTETRPHNVALLACIKY